MTAFDEFVATLATHGNAPCIIDGDGECSYASFVGAMRSWQAQLQRWQIDAGTVVGLRADYSVAAISLLLAMLARHSIVALIPRHGETAQWLRSSRANYLVEVDEGGELHVSEVAQPAGEPLHPLLASLRQTGEGGLVIFTSGSTGEPKAALHGAARFVGKFAHRGRRLCTLGFSTLDHVAGVDTLLYTLANGAPFVVARRRDPQSICALIECAGVEVLPAAPSFLRMLCMSHAASGHDLSSLKIITYGSETMDTDTLARLNRAFPQVRISQKYGTTETGAPRTISRGADSLWIRFPDVETRVVDEVLWIRSDSTLLGYLNAPSPQDDKGWYCTGDLVDVDGEWIRIRGRASGVINVGGEKVDPAEVEQVILSLDFVRSTVVSGAPHVLMGNVVTAQICVSRDVDPVAAARQVRQACRRQLAAYKVPVTMKFVEHDLVTERQKKRRS